MRRLNLLTIFVVFTLLAGGCRGDSLPSVEIPTPSVETPTSAAEASVEYVGLSLAEILQLRDGCLQEKPDSLCLPLPVNPEQYKVGVIGSLGKFWNVSEIGLCEADSALNLRAYKDLHWFDQSQLDRPVRNYWFRIWTGGDFIEPAYAECDLLIDEQGRIVFILPDERGALVVFFP